MPEYVIIERNGRFVLPGTGDVNCVEVSVWSDSAANYRRFAKPFYPNKNSTKAVITTAVLVHHDHNKYNSNAISVSTPAATDATIRKRHLGYLRDTYLRKVGTSNLPDLIQLAGGEVEVTLVLAGLDALSIDLPDGKVLCDAINAVLTRHGLEGAPSNGNRSTPRIYAHSGRSADTRRTLRLLQTMGESVPKVDGVEVFTDRGLTPQRRTYTLREAGTGNILGSIEQGVVFLNDEPNREQVLAHLAAQDFPVVQPVTLPTIPEDGTWPAATVPNGFFRRRSGSLDLRARNPQEKYSQESFAIYNTTTHTMWVEDSHLVAPALRMVHRLGIDPRSLGLPKKSWNLDDEVAYHSLRAQTNSGQRSGPRARPRVLVSRQRLLPDGVLTAGEVEWHSDETTPTKPEPTESFLRLERHVAERTTLFPENTLTGAVAPCRLCANPTGEFTTPISTTALAYCHDCLASAITGLGENRDRAAVALKELAVLEFDDQPMIETQLDSLHINPEEPVDATTIDQLLLLRFAIPRRHVAWTLLLEAAGFAERGLRMARGTLIRARDGHLCLSLRERTVCDFLHLHGIGHEREPHYPQDIDYNPKGLRRADWKLTDGTYVELWGMPKDPKYAAKMDEKRRLAARHNIRLVELLEIDLPNLPTIFDAWFAPSQATGWTWSPLMVVSEAAAARRIPPTSTGDNRGRNEANVTTRAERLERCIDAVAHQEAGLSRSEIASLMGIGRESLKALLRDGKFYLDPESDSIRHELAIRAAKARDERQTRAAFQALVGITNPKAQEAWRDAGVLFE